MQFFTRPGDRVFALAIAFLIGIFIGDSTFDARSAIVLLLLFASGPMLFFRRRAMILLLTGLCAAIIAGVFYCRAYDMLRHFRSAMPLGAVTVLGAVSEEPKPVTGFMMLTVALARPYAGIVDVFMPPAGRFVYGDFIQLTGKIDAPKVADEHPSLFLPRARLIAQHKGFFLKELFINAKSAALLRFDAFLPREQAGLLEGIMFGSANGLDQAFKTQMEASGTSYIIGMYGYKLALLIATLRMAAKDRLSRKVFFVVATLALVGFVFASGASTSVLRAGVMGFFTLLAGVSGRRANPRNALTAAALILIALDPRALLEAGFQLSFLSFLGISLLSTPLKNLFHWNDGGFLQWKEHAIMSLATNLAIIPVAMIAFGDFPVTSLISNTVIMIPWVLIVFFGVALLLLGSFSYYAALFVGKVLSMLLGYELLIINIFSRVNIPTPSVVASWPGTIFFYGLLFIFIYHYGHYGARSKAVD